MTLADGVFAGLTSLFALVAIGSIVPVVPTGAVVTAAAAVALHHNVLTVVAVVVVGAVAAYLGDVVVYEICRLGGEPMLRRFLPSILPKNPTGDAVASADAGRDGSGGLRLAELARRRLRARTVMALVVARLIPAGRVPMLVAVAVMGTDRRRVLVGCLAACGSWSAVYAGVGLLGGAVFARPWQGVLAAVLLVLVLSLVAGRVRRASGTASDPSAAAGPGTGASCPPSA